MQIIELQDHPVAEFRYLNAGDGPGRFYEDRLPIHVARVDQLPKGVAALIAAADLQGRELFKESPHGVPRLLGEALPERLVTEVLPALSLMETGRIGVLLAGDFYTVPALDKRGGTGDVTQVWKAFANCFGWVAGVPGNHDTFGDAPQRRPRFPARMHYLDGDVVDVNGLRIAGLGGIIGNTTRPQRRDKDDYLASLHRLILSHPDLLLMHEGPAGSAPEAPRRLVQPGLSEAREMLLDAGTRLVIRGHSHWTHPLAEFDNGLQILNVCARVVILTN